MISVAVVLLRACVMLTIYSRNHGVLKSINQEMPHSDSAEQPMAPYVRESHNGKTRIRVEEPALSFEKIEKTRKDIA